MNIRERFKIDFGPNYDCFSYKPSFEKTGFIDYEIYPLISISNYIQFTVISVETLDEDFTKLPNSIMAYQNGEKPGNYNIFFLLNQKEDFANIPHNRNVYIYCKDLKVDRETVVQYFLRFKLRAIIRDNKYFENLKADFFISHDSRDKDEVARPLYEELTKRGYKVWYDEFSLKIGDSLTESIDKGIATSKYGIVILSKNFLSNERWAKNELQSLRTKQILVNKNILLPIWHNISEEDFKENYWLLEKVGGKTKNGIKVLVDQLEEKYKTA